MKNKTMRYRKLIILLFFISICSVSCKKYLDKPSSKSQVIPSTLKDAEAILDYFAVHSNGCSLNEAGGDNYYVTTADWQQILSQQNTYQALTYIWEGTDSDPSWFESYRYPVYHSNVVLDLLPGISKADIKAWNNVKGSALFYRAFAFWSLAQVYCRPYTPSAVSDPGMPLRLNPIIEEKSVRSSVQETYTQIINDLKQALLLLTPTILAPSRPGRTAAYGALARVYLSMRDYSNAGLYADSSLRLQSALLDYNTLSATANNPIPLYPNNPELVLDNRLGPNAVLSGNSGGTMKVDTLLYRSYDINDLRKSIFFKVQTDGTIRFQGSYSFSTNYTPFDGLATNEMYLIRAESLARSGKATEAMADLNKLLQTRWRNTAWVPFTAINAQDALQKILAERRKELCFRGLRWSDIRRLNLENANISITRKIAGTTYLLPANDLRFVYLIPKEIINISGMQQNPR